MGLHLRKDRERIDEERDPIFRQTLQPGHCYADCGEEERHTGIAERQPQGCDVLTYVWVWMEVFREPRLPSDQRPLYLVGVIKMGVGVELRPNLLRLCAKANRAVGDCVLGIKCLIQIDMYANIEASRFLEPYLNIKHLSSNCPAQHLLQAVAIQVHRSQPLCWSGHCAK